MKTDTYYGAFVLSPTTEAVIQGRGFSARKLEREEFSGGLRCGSLDICLHWSMLYWTCINRHPQCSYISTIPFRFSSCFCVQIHTSCLPQRVRLCHPFLNRFLVATHRCMLRISSLSLPVLPLVYLQSFFILIVDLPKERKHIIWKW